MLQLFCFQLLTTKSMSSVNDDSDSKVYLIYILTFGKIGTLSVVFSFCRVKETWLIEIKLRLKLS